jgi:hypothetical protein
MRGSLRDCTLALHLNSRSSDAAGVFAVAACTLAAAAIIALVYSAPSRAADPYDKFDSAIASWNKTCQHQVWPNLDSQCRRGAEVGTVRIIGGPQIPSEFYRDAEGLDPSNGATSCAAAGHSCLTATPATRANKA